MKYIVFFYTMKNDPDLIKELVPEHIKYWKGLDLSGYKGGPFFDRSGGLITFSCDDFEVANKIINDDPFVKGQAISDMQVKNWISGN
jgi:uncharacterized protein YciI